MRKESGIMDFAEMCVIRFEQELCTHIFFLPFIKLMKYNVSNKLEFEEKKNGR